MHLPDPGGCPPSARGAYTIALNSMAETLATMRTPGPARAAFSGTGSRWAMMLYAL